MPFGLVFSFLYSPEIALHKRRNVMEKRNYQYVEWGEDIK